MKVAAVTGLDAEAQVARRAGITARPSGGVPSQTRDIAEGFLREGVELLLSFGIAGALEPSLRPGAILLPHSVTDEEGRRFLADDTQHAQALAKLRRSGIAVEEGGLLGATEAAASPARKIELFQMAHAVAVDLESHIVAQVAARAGRPFIVLRAIADRASQALPRAAVTGLAPNGKPALGRVVLSVARDPRQIPALIRLAGDTRKALDALNSALRVLSLSL